MQGVKELDHSQRLIEPISSLLGCEAVEPILGWDFFCIRTAATHLGWD